MKLVKFNPTYLVGDDLEWWTKWTARASTAHGACLAAVKQGGEPFFDGTVWRDLKEWLSNKVFHGRCAYCESEIGVTDYVTADHYRPKGEVTEDKNHCGYYWLAHSWQNIFPTCIGCNSRHKRSKFPIRGRRVFSLEEASSIEDLDRIEAPLLLRPCDENDPPEKHIKITFYGSAVALNKSERGRATIETCGINREPLDTARKARQEIEWERYLKMQGNCIDGVMKELYDQQLRDQNFEYSTAVLAYMRFMIRRQKLVCPALFENEVS